MGDWQKLFVGILVDLGLSNDIAMLVMGKTCDLRQKAYMQGYERGWAAALNQGKPTAQPTTDNKRTLSQIADKLVSIRGKLCQNMSVAGYDDLTECIRQLRLLP